MAWLGLGRPHLFSVCLKTPAFWGRGCKSSDCIDKRIVKTLHKWPLPKALEMMALTYWGWVYEDGV